MPESITNIVATSRKCRYRAKFSEPQLAGDAEPYDIGHVDGQVKHVTGIAKSWGRRTRIIGGQIGIQCDDSSRLVVHFSPPNYALPGPVSAEVPHEIGHGVLLSSSNQYHVSSRSV